MKIVRFFSDGETRYGLVKGEEIKEIQGNVFGEYRVTRKTYQLATVKPLAPCLPSKIVAIGLNYRDHAEEVKKALPEEPMIFMKPPTAVIGPEEAIIYPRMSKRVDYEAELGVVIGRTAKNVPEERALDYVLGYTCFNDVTARDLQAKDGQFARSKGFDTFAPMGPWIATGVDPRAVAVRSYLNGELRQNGNTKNLIFSVPFLVSFISRVMTLLPGDVIATGTPAGIGPMQPGDVIEIEVEGMGRLRNTVISE